MLALVAGFLVFFLLLPTRTLPSIKSSQLCLLVKDTSLHVLSPSPFILTVIRQFSKLQLTELTANKPANEARW